ncbi:ABC transporter ATP-binding protein [Bacillus haynesii]|uniref:ABC transporter ATP-binding protein n=1 Tax=Bacillus haynesii TaxID=1925021 RepID=UPI001F601AFA|nr:ABC transporter ATP-binding protein [Bacillus haynesii]MCI4128657.1 ABC transporter ATP-binding protein [Bacillus haynesii]
MDAIAIENLSVSISSNNIIRNLSVNIPNNEITGILGTNGSGKSTLLRTISKLLKPDSGRISIHGKPLSSYSAKKLAQTVSMLPQSYDSDLDMTVYELVEQGRFPHAGAIKMLKKQDHEAINLALELTKLVNYQDRKLSHLSGGERQRAWIALSIAQESPILLLDEPTTFLDVQHQLAVLDLIQSLNKQQRKTVVMVLHDINQAIKYCDQMMIMKDGRLYAQGRPENVITEKTLHDVFGVEAHFFNEPETDRQICFPFRYI